MTDAELLIDSSVGCRWCGSSSMELVLDLGAQSSAAELPALTDPTPDPTAPLRLMLCRSCTLVQLDHGKLDPEGPMGIEPRAMQRQAAQVVLDLTRAGYFSSGLSVTEYSSPHSGDWSAALRQSGMESAGESPADVVLDVFGLMHEPDQRAALDGRIASLRSDGTIVVQIHSLEGDIERSAWSIVRHGHYAYYTVTVMIALLAERGFVALDAFEYPLQGGTVVIVFRRNGERSPRVRTLLERERLGGLSGSERLAERVGVLRSAAAASSMALRSYLDDCKRAGRSVGAYPASTGSVALLALAGVTRADVIAVGDISSEKQGRALPGSRIPIVTPDELMIRPPRRVLLFVPDLLDELRDQYPEFERDGGRWVVVAPYPEEMAEDARSDS